MIIQSDEASIARLMGVAVTQIPERVLEEYELRLRMYHCDGNSGALGTLGIIDMLRFLKAPNRLKDKPQAPVDWQRIPRDGSVRVVASVLVGEDERKWTAGVFRGVTRLGTLAVLIDGDTWVKEFSREDVRIARNKPRRPLIEEEETDEPTPQEDLPLKERDPWVSMRPDEEVLVELEDDYQEGKFRAVVGDEIMVVFGDDVTPRAYPPDKVTVVEESLQPKEQSNA